MINKAWLKELCIDEIEYDYDLADLDEDTIEQLRLKIEESGSLMYPPIVSEDGTLLSGRHRLEALRRSKLEEGWFIVVEATGDDAEVASIDEDLCRRRLSALEQCEMLERHDRHLAESGLRTLPLWLFEEARSTTPPGRVSAGSGTRAHFGRPPTDPDRASLYTTEDLAEEAGVSKETYLRRLRIAREICEDARDLVRSTGLPKSQQELERLSRVPEDEQVAVARLLADERAETVASAVHAIRMAKAKASGARFEASGEGYRIVQAVPSDWTAIVDAHSISLIVTYVPDATGRAPVWDTEAEARHTKPIVDAHRDLALMAAQALMDGGSLVVMAGSHGSDQILAAMRTHIDFVDSIPFLVESSRGTQWRAMLWFANGEVPPRKLLPIHSRPLDSLLFDDVIRCLSSQGEEVFDPYGHCEIAGSVLYLKRRYLGFQPTPDDVGSLADKLELDLETLAEAPE